MFDATEFKQAYYFCEECSNWNDENFRRNNFMRRTIVFDGLIEAYNHAIQTEHKVTILVRKEND